MPFHARAPPPPRSTRMPSLPSIVPVSSGSVMRAALMEWWMRGAARRLRLGAPCGRRLERRTHALEEGCGRERLLHEGRPFGDGSGTYDHVVGVPGGVENGHSGMKDPKPFGEDPAVDPRHD